MPDEFLLKSVVFKLISKEISRAEHEYMNIHSPINAVATALFIRLNWVIFNLQRQEQLGSEKLNIKSVAVVVHLLGMNSESIINTE